MKSWAAALIFTSCLLPLPLEAAPTFTGNVPDDFDSTDPATLVTEDTVGDVGVPSGLPPGTISGLDMAAVWFFYDPATDILHVGIETPAIAGDVDGDGDPGGTSQALQDNHGVDHPDFGDTETFSVFFDTDGDGNPDVIAGKPSTRGTTIQDYVVSTFNQSLGIAYVSLDLVFDTELPDHQGIIFGSPTADAPHLEFTVEQFSRLPGFSADLDPWADPIEFSFGCYMGSADAVGVGVDFILDEGQTLLAARIEPPLGSIDGKVFEDWNLNGQDDAGDAPASQVQVLLDGDVDRDGTVDLVRTRTDGDGLFLFSDLATGTYTVTVAPPFGFSVAPASFEIELAPRESATVPSFALHPTDQDGDGIYDVVEGTEDQDGDGDPNYLDTDADGDGIPDEVEAGGDAGAPRDTDTDGTPDFLDSDSDADGIADAVEAGPDPTSPIDSDGDGLPDYRDLDSDGDGIPDLIEGGDDLDGDGIANYLDEDSDGDGILDAAEAGPDPIYPTDTDEDGRPDYLDDDADGDGILDQVETDQDSDQDGTPNYLDDDSDGDGIPDRVETASDQDGDGTPNYLDLDSDADGVEDALEAGATPDSPADHDGDQTPDFLDLDSDADGILDQVEGVTDPDGDGIPCFLDDDSDGDGISDQAEAGPDPAQPIDSDGDLAPDYLDLDSDADGIPDQEETGADKDGDGTPNFRDLDSDGDGIPDSLEAGADPGQPADFDGDGRPDFLDTDADDDGLADVLEGGADLDGDGLLDRLDDTDGDGTPDVHDADSDGDGILDGTEAGITSDSAGPDTDVNSPTFVPDGDPTHTSDPDDQDTDDDCLADGDEDANHDGARDAGETWPDEVDSDGDGLQDGTELGVTGGTPDTLTDVCILDADAGETTTDPTVADTDGGGVDDGSEDANHNGQVDEGETDPNFLEDDLDRDEDGLSDLAEEAAGTDPDNPDSDGDGLLDGTEGVEDRDGDGIPNALDDDSDGDGVPDSEEAVDPETGAVDQTNPQDTDGDGTPDFLDIDADDDGLLDEEEPEGDHDGDGLPGYRDPDSDNDGLYDGTESGVTEPSEDTHPETGTFVPDGDPSTTTDLEDADTDDDGILDGNEDINQDGIQDFDETSPLHADSDGDCLQDGVEVGLPTPQQPIAPATNMDTDPEGFIPDADPSTTTDPLEADTDEGGADDGDEDRNCNGAMDPGEGDPNDPSDDPYFVDSDDDGLLDVDEPILGTDPFDADSDDDGLLDGEEGTGDADQDGIPDALEPDADGDGLLDGQEAGLTGADIGLDTHPGVFVPDADPSTTTDPRDRDSDDDGLEDGEEDINLNGAQDEGETDPANRDSDADGLQDGTELGLESGDESPDTAPSVFQPDQDPETTTDPLDADTDDDGLLDGTEDLNHNGAVDPDEPDPNEIDTDQDGLLDGTEAGVGTWNVGDDTDPEIFVPDEDPTTTTDPADDDTDDDGLLDGTEDADHNGDRTADETDPSNPDTDGDCIQDGTELGLTVPEGEDTDPDLFVPDADPTTTTDPLSSDTDGGGVPDGGPEAEDANCNGAVDEGERDPLDPEDDVVPELPVTVMGGGGCQGCSTSGSPDHGTLLAVGVVLVSLIRRRRKNSSRSAAPLLLALVLAHGSARAQTAALEVQQFHPALDVYGGIVTSGSQTLPSGRFVVGLWADYADSPLVLMQGDQRVGELQKAVLGANLGAAVGILDALQAFLLLPATPYQDAPSTDLVGIDPSRAALNDMALGLRLRILNRMDRRTGLAFEPRLWLPTGSPEAYTGGQFSVGANLIADVLLGKVWLGANVGYRYRPTPLTLGTLTVDDELVYRAGIGVPAGQWYLTADLFGVTGVAAAESQGVSDAPLEAMVGLSRSLGETLTLTLAAAAGLVAGYGSPDYRVLAGIAWGASRTNDRDRDGIVDTKDLCPTAPEDRDGFQDHDGCPDSDNDQDGIEDGSDRCPDMPEDRDGFEDDDGCLDADNDRDQLPDEQDACPNDPEDIDGFEDADGCPDPDNDGDGIADVDDTCPFEAEDLDGWEDEDGCPDLDNDGDGIADADDRCPDDQEDPDGFDDEDGCPEMDNDGDGILDTVDRCPDEPETMNGVEDEDGCPEEGAPVAEVVVQEDKLVLPDRIYFEFDQAVIRPESYPTLQQAIKFLRQHPNLRIRIEGHTDSKGAADYNLRLSQARADAVKQYLVEVGRLDPSRFETQGFGETRPVATNATERGRALNRRIEWTILDR